MDTTMNIEKTIKTAYELGREFGEYLNQHPEEAQNWSHLSKDDDLPEEDYLTLRDQHECGVTDSMEEAYRDGFNSVFKPLTTR